MTNPDERGGDYSSPFLTASDEGSDQQFTENFKRNHQSIQIRVTE